MGRVVPVVSFAFVDLFVFHMDAQPDAREIVRECFGLSRIPCTSRSGGTGKLEFLEYIVDAFERFNNVG